MPEAVRFVVWDLDDTFWKGTITEGGILEYVQSHHDIVIELAKRGIISSICSKNDPDTVMPVLEEKGILDYFVLPSISWDAKGARLASLTEAVQLRPSTIMFVDDNPLNRAEAAAAVPDMQIEDETFISRMLTDPRFMGKSDPELTRLNQYKLLEMRKRDEARKPGTNEDFLRGCDVRVCIEYGVETHIDRAIELINRTNQLNYTKKRLSEDQATARLELRDQMRAFDRSVGLVRVADKYGDHGFIGFFMTGGMRQNLEAGAANTHLVHYCFSCRTLGMRIEQWVYNFLGRPELNVVGDVLTDLSLPHDVDWVRLVQTIDHQSPPYLRIAPQIALCGGCEAQAIGVYLGAYTDKLDVYGSYVAGGIFVGTNYASRILDVCDRDVDEIAPELEVLGLPAHLETGDFFKTAAPGTLFVLNLGMDAHGCDRLRHKVNDWTFVLAPNGLLGEDLYGESEARLDEIFQSESARYTTHQQDQIRRLRVHLREKYEIVPPPGEFDIAEDMRGIIGRIPQGSKLIILVDNDKRRSGPSGHELVSIPDIARYRHLMEEIAEEFPYVAVIGIGDLIHAPDDILDGNHYTRRIYNEVAERVAEVAIKLDARFDVPVSKRRLARLAMDRKHQRHAIEKTRDLSDTRDLVEATYQTLLRRQPDPSGANHAVESITSGAMSPASYIRLIGDSEEFGHKWAATEPEQQVNRSNWIDVDDLRGPRDLSVNTFSPQRVIFVGSCLSEDIVLRMKGLPVPCEADFYFVGSELPEMPERSFSEYDFQIVQLALRHALPDGAFARLGQLDKAGHERLFEQAANVVRQHFELAMAWNRSHGLLTFVIPFIVPSQNHVGRLLPRYDLSNPVYFVEQLNVILYQEMMDYLNTYSLDINEILGFHGRRFTQDDVVSILSHSGVLANFDAEFDSNRLEAAGKVTDFFDTRVSEFFLVLWREITCLYRSVRQLDQVKMVVVDLDDTMWRGIVAESDGDNLPTAEGWPKGFWEALLLLKRRGVLLAIISKNEESHIRGAWTKIFGTVLQIEDFVVHRINWNPKADNMAEILAYVSLLPGSILYIDDNPVERAAIQAAFPEIRTLGGTPLLWRRILLWSSETQVAKITMESATRSAMVRAQVAREDQRRAMPREEFLASLNVQLSVFEIKRIDHFRFDRVLELVNRSNQFNTTGRRWSPEEFGAGFAQGMSVFAFTVHDRHTDYGLVGVVIVSGPEIVQFVMSCRVLGLGIEQAVISLIGEIMISRGSHTVSGAMVETDRNQACRNLYSQCGFTLVDGGWRRGSESWFAVPGHIQSKVEISQRSDELAAVDPS